ncbi:hypothetical protein [uncultured Neglectibacter sp.]|uniref:hypothetical protein n=1 Tax=uncultured Neglectibacter sp. TaxID=1924108 RepID=UPI0034DF8C0D
MQSILSNCPGKVNLFGEMKKAEYGFSHISFSSFSVSDMRRACLLPGEKPGAFPKGKGVIRQDIGEQRLTSQ